MAKIDWLILTAANRSQARGYTAQMKARDARGLLANVAHWQVVPDPGGKRVGSGGSTLWVLYQIASALARQRPEAKRLADLFQRQRIVVIHSGGDSRRLCAYAAQGKAFTPLPCDVPTSESDQRGLLSGDRQPAKLFDLIASELAGLPAPSQGQVLLAAGDVLLTFNRRAVDFDQPGVVGVAYPGTLARGSRHGVYVASRDGAVRDFLQKPDEATARARGAVDNVDRVLVDTGLLSLDPPAAERWLEMAGVSLTRRGELKLGPGLLADLCDGRAATLDLYQQILMAMPPKIDEASYVESMGNPGESGVCPATHRRHLTTIHRALHGQPLHVNVLPYCEFFHVGSSGELLENIDTLSRTAQVYRFANFHRSAVADRASLEGAFVYNSLLTSRKVNAGDGVLIEACHTDQALALPGRNIVVGWPAEAKRELRLPPGLGLVCLPIKGRAGQSPRWSVVLFGVEDDFKTARGQGGSFGNEPMDALLERGGIKPSMIWRAGRARSQTLWDAKLWPVGSIKEVMDLSFWMMGRSRPPAELLGRWRESKRRSMRQLMEQVDHQRLIEHRREIQRRVGLARIGERVQAHPWLSAAELLGSITDAREARTAVDQLKQQIHRTADPLAAARWARLAEAVAQAYPPIQAKVGKAENFRQQWLASVANSVSRSTASIEAPRQAAILKDQVIWVTTPVRLDLAGGWSDTPPICAELGGTVLNAAITLNGQYPVQVIAKLSDEPVITLNSIDLGQRLKLTDARELAGVGDPHQWYALPKAALKLSGLVPDVDRAKGGRASLRRHLESFGGGLDITLFSALPKGSGLGTSSVLGAAMLACLARIGGVTLSREQLYARTTLLEQLMTTGGGWQDQIGAITPGVKLIRTQPGAEQVPTLSWTGLDVTGRGVLDGRLLLYFTGIKRMAKDILHQVVSRYLARDPETLAIIHQLKAEAEQMKRALDIGDVSAFIAGVDSYWRLKQRIDPGATNEKIQRLLKPVDRYLGARLLPGAGGGGFVFMIAKDAGAAKKVRQTLEANPINGYSRFFDFQFDQKGLSVTRL